MNSKKIPLISLATILILSTFALGNTSFAFTTEGDRSIIKVKGLATCDDSGEDCGQGQANGKFRLLATDEEGTLTKGVAKGTLCILPDIDEQRCIFQMKNIGPIGYQYDSLERIIAMRGSFVDQNTGVLYDYDAVGNIADFNKKKGDIDLSMKFEGTTGIVIDVTGAGIVIDVTGAG